MTVRLGIPAKKAPTDASDTRLDWRNHTTRNADGTIRTGVTYPITSGSIVTSTATTGPMTVSVAAFDATAARDNGAVYLSNDGVVPATITPAPVAGSSRLDVVYAMQHDTSTGVSTPDADDLAGVYVAAGAPTTGTPVKPAIPAAAVELATVLVPSGVTATNAGGVVITQTFQFTAPMAAPVPFASKAKLDLWTTARPEQLATVFGDPTAALNGEYSYTGGAWKKMGNAVIAAPPAVLAGTVPPVGARIYDQAGLVTLNTSAGGDVTLNFPTAFPNGLLSVQLQRQDFATFGATVEIGSQSVPPTLAAFVFRVFATTTGSPVASATGIKYSFIAKGW